MILQFFMFWLGQGSGQSIQLGNSPYASSVLPMKTSMNIAHLDRHLCYRPLFQQSFQVQRGKSRNRTFSKIENLRFLQNYDDYNIAYLVSN